MMAAQTKKAEKIPLCQGKVFFYDEKTRCGSIKGFDRNEYAFSFTEWKNKNEKPRTGMVVNFEVKDHEKGKEAISIRIR